MNNLKAVEKIIKNGVPSNLNINIKDHISGEYPLEIPFHLDDKTTVITAVYLYYTVEKISTPCGETQGSASDSITIFVDNTECITATDSKGAIDLIAWITTPGWHEIEIRSTGLKKIMAQISIKSFIQM